MQQAELQGFDDAILCHVDGYLCEATTSNLFWVKNQVVHTPALECGILPGTIRQLILEICAEQHIPCQQAWYTVDDLLESDEAFCSNSSTWIKPIGQVDGQKISLGPISRMLHQHIAEIIRKNCKQ